MSNFSRNDSEMAAEWLSEKFQLLKYEHICHFKARDLDIPLILIITDFVKFLKVFIKSRNLNISRK